MDNETAEDRRRNADAAMRIADMLDAAGARTLGDLFDTKQQGGDAA